MNEGDEGSVPLCFEVAVTVNGGCIDRPFIFLGLRGEGDVIGRANARGWGMPSISVLVVDCGSPNVVEG